MTRYELKQRLMKENVPHIYYGINGIFFDNVFVLNKNNERWETYWTEKGNKYQLKVFDTEEEACEYYYNWLMEIIKQEEERQKRIRPHN